MNDIVFGYSLVETVTGVVMVTVYSLGVVALGGLLFKTSVNLG